MITQRHSRYGDFTDSKTYFIIGSSENQIYDELKEFIEKYGTDNNEIWIYEDQVRPSKINLRPEYSLEVQIREKGHVYFMTWFRRVH